MRILVANRGEIALRIIKSIKAMGHESVAIYSRADKNSMHVAAADLKVCVGPELSTESYLNMVGILTAATAMEVDAIHPGYGFLSENSNFANLCEQLNIIFIGPSSQSIEMMGDKINALKVMQKASSSNNQFIEITNRDQLPMVEEKIGLPLIIKYAQGGGGKGMRIIRPGMDIVTGYELVLSEAKQAESEPRIFAEKFIQDAKHIEVQIIGDQYGNAVAIGTRDCSMQRNNQKVIEEAPANVKDEVLDKLYLISTNIAKEIAYCGVGTVEFMVDDTNVYFLEMNTRLQVEHTVTEEITGLDLVALQIAVANGGNLDELLPKVELQGHAIECRINAECPQANFMPSPGTITKLEIAEDVRLDFGFKAGDTIPPYYDSMIGKVICYAPTRDQAIAKMITTLETAKIEGIETNIDFNLRLLQDDEFVQNTHNTQYITANLNRLIGKEQ